MENAANEIPMSTKQFIDTILTQSLEFQAGLDVVVAGAIANQVQPYAIAAGCAASMIRITSAVGLSNKMSFDEIKKTITELVENILEDSRPSYEALTLENSAS